MFGMTPTDTNTHKVLQNPRGNGAEAGLCTCMLLMVIFEGAQHMYLGRFCSLQSMHAAYKMHGRPHRAATVHDRLDMYNRPS